MSPKSMPSGKHFPKELSPIIKNMPTRPRRGEIKYIQLFIWSFFCNMTAHFLLQIFVDANSKDAEEPGAKS